MLICRLERPAHVIGLVTKFFSEKLEVKEFSDYTAIDT